MRSRRGRRERLPFVDDINAQELERGASRVARIVLYTTGNDEAVAGLDLEGGLAFHQDLALAFENVADLISRMRVSSGRSSRRDLDFRDDALAARHGYVFPRYDRTLDGGSLREENCSGEKEEGA